MSLRTRKFIGSITVLFAMGASVHAVDVQVTITNNASPGGVAITPVWVGFHSGSFDSYNAGLAAQPGLESLAEDGATGTISSQFLDFDATIGGLTYIGPGPSNALVRTGDLSDANRVDRTIGSMTGPPPISPGESASQILSIQTDGSNRYFSYASMVLPSNDFFVANGNPLAHDVTSLYGGSGSMSFNIGTVNTVNDAGTEAEDFNTSAANGLLGLAGGQGSGDTPVGSLGQPITSVNGALPLDALNFSEGSQPQFDFNNAGLYPDGIATITITAIPEPSAVVLAVFGLVLSVWPVRRQF